MTEQEIKDAINNDPELKDLAILRNDAEIAKRLSVGRKKVNTLHLTERGVRALSVLPRNRHALLTTLKDAASTTPVWFIPTLTALGIPTEDHAALVNDLSSADYWLHNADGLDVGSSAARSMLDLIAVGVPLSAPACIAVKALAEVPDPVSINSISDVLSKGL